MTKKQMLNTLEKLIEREKEFIRASREEKDYEDLPGHEATLHAYEEIHYMIATGDTSHLYLSDQDDL